MDLNRGNCLLLIMALVWGSKTLAWDTISNGMDIHCQQTEVNSLDCRYRPILPGVVSSVSASVGKLELPVNMAGENRNMPTAIFFLIDTSDPGRQEVIDRNIKQVEKLLQSASDSYRIGLATFDRKLRILAPIGSSPSQIIAAAQGIRAEGRTTELYRSLLLTIEKLSRTSAVNRVIYLFSDGQAEDKAYFHGDVVKAARNKGVVINSIGFPRSVSLSVALQTLRRLSEETGGTFTESGRNFSLSDSYYRSAYDNVDIGARFSVDLSSLAKVSSASQNRVRLAFSSDIGDFEVTVPVALAITRLTPLPAPAVTPTPPPPVADSSPEIRIVAPVDESESINFWLWYGLPAAIVLLFLISLVTLILTYRKQPGNTSSLHGFPQQTKPFAYLVTQEEKPRRYPILNTTWRIGRSQDNELVLDDSSVSRLHAEIHRYNNGNFFILDMKSLNGIYVNDEQVSKKKLEEGDMIEVGDIYLRFTKFSEDNATDDDTAMQVTRTPVH